MPLLPIAAFLAGALLSILLPLVLLIALVTWYWTFIRRLPDPVEGGEARTTGVTTEPRAVGPGTEPLADGSPDVTTPPSNA